MCAYVARITNAFSDMGWLRLVGSLKLQVSLVEYRLFYRALLQKRPMISRSLLIEATPYVASSTHSVCVFDTIYIYTYMCVCCMLHLHGFINMRVHTTAPITKVLSDMGISRIPRSSLKYLIPNTHVYIHMCIHATATITNASLSETLCRFRKEDL